MEFVSAIATRYWSCCKVIVHPSKCQKRLISQGFPYICNILDMNWIHIPLLKKCITLFTIIYDTM